eukprot:11112514-Ditylum_brightwellii.AAC.1
MGHPQPPTLVMMGNSTICSIVNKMVKQRHTRAIDMQFYWVRDHCAQKYFIVYWVPGEKNLGDYHTKHHPTPHHKKMWRHFVRNQELIANHGLQMDSTSLQGCVKSILELNQVQSRSKDKPDELMTWRYVTDSNGISELMPWASIR